MFSKKLLTLLIWLLLKFYKVANKVKIESGFPFILGSEREMEGDYLNWKEIKKGKIMQERCREGKVVTEVVTLRGN